MPLDDVQRRQSASTASFLYSTLALSPLCHPIAKKDGEEQRMAEKVFFTVQLQKCIRNCAFRLPSVR